MVKAEVVKAYSPCAADVVKEISDFVEVHVQSTPALEVAIVYDPDSDYYF